MKYALIENGLVTQCSCRKIESYISCPDHVCPGYLYSNEEFTAPEIKMTTEQKIEQLESEQTARMLRQAALGDTESIAMLQAIEDQIAELRLEL